ncbi:MAG: outer-membrane lipoprotein carrier protein LolA [Clostridia bacterium]|nr:outer-membrane lipoprotein carrier protein LolA [Clostridia bacterium]
MKRLFLFLCIMILSGCVKQESSYPTIQDKLMAMTGYSADCKLTYISNKGETIYETKQIAAQDGRYRIETKKPEEYKDNVILYDGKMVWQYNPNLKENKISVNPPDKAARREIILFSFIENYVKSKDVGVETANLDESLCTVLEAKITGNNKLLSTEKLWVDNESQNPLKLVIYDTDNKERIVAEFSNFVYNCNLEDKTFLMDK